MRFEEAFKRACEVRAELCNACKTEEDLIAVSSALSFQAVTIWKEMGGPEHAARQLYAMADRLASEVPVHPTGK